MDQVMGVRVCDLPVFFPRCVGFRNNIKHSDEIGAEFEIEGNRLPSALEYHWRATQDGSLRGPHAEYVLRKPVSFNYFKTKSFPYLLRQIKKSKAQIKMSGRCSTHIHVNIHPLYMYQVWLFTAMYYLFEQALSPYMGHNRIGNLFCIGAGDSNWIGNELEQRACDNPLSMLGGDNRYAAVNMCAVARYGSLEFRALKGTLDKDEVYRWIDVLLSIRNYVSRQKPGDIPGILERLSVEGPSGFLFRVIGNRYEELVEMAGGVNQLDAMIYAGVNRVQSMFYECDWNQLIVKDPKTKPIEHAHLLFKSQTNLNTKTFLRNLDHTLVNELNKINKGENKDAKESAVTWAAATDGTETEAFYAEPVRYAVQEGVYIGDEVAEEPAEVRENTLTNQPFVIRANWTDNS